MIKIKLKEITSDWTWPDYGVIVLILVFVSFNKLMPIVLVGTALSIISIRNSNSEVRELLSFRYPFFWFIIFFMVHIVGLTYSENMEFGIADVGMKASFIIFPLFLAITKLKLKFRHLVDAYLISILISCVLCFTYAIFRSIYYYEDNRWAYFTESYFSYMMHRSYFATYLALGTLIAVVQFFNSNKLKMWYLFLACLFLFSTVLTFSKAGILILMVLMIPLCFYLTAKFYKRIYALIAVVSFVVGITLMISFSSKLSTRFEKMFDSITTSQSTENVAIESSTSRVIMWSTSLELARENLLFGVGTGDVKDQLNERNIKNGNLEVVKKNLNSHNQYLNTVVQLGLLGLIPLIMILLTTFFLAIKKRNVILLLITCTFGITMLFESFLETQAGIMPVTFLLLLFSLIVINKKEDIITPSQT